MSCCSACGRHACACGCAASPRTPLSLYNRPGLDSLTYRVGTYADFMATMQMDLSATALPALQGLRTRSLDDPSMALLDAWAVGADVISFYQERIANEGYLRTATERCSVLQLGRLLDYRLRPGVSASVYLAYTINGNSPPVTIPAGAKAQSVPAPGEQMQTFETAEPLEARSEWNALLPRLTRPPYISLDQITRLDTLWVDGVDKHLKQGDRLLFLFGGLATGEQALRVVASAEVQQASTRTKVTLQPVDGAKVQIIDAAGVALAGLAANATDPIYSHWHDLMAALRRTLLLGGDYPGHDVNQAAERMVATLPPPVETFLAAVKNILAGGSGSSINPPLASIGLLLSALTLAPQAQLANSLLLRRSATDALSLASDARPQLLVSFESRLSRNFYWAWGGMPQGAPPPGLSAVHVLRASACLFGYNAVNRTLLSVPSTSSQDWTPTGPDLTKNVLCLDNAYDAIAPNSYLVVQPPESGSGARASFVAQVGNVKVHPRTDYATSGKTTEIGLSALSGTSVWDISGDNDISALRGTQVFAQSEPLPLAPIPIDDAVGNTGTPNMLGDGATRLTLDGIVDGLKPGRWVVVTGQRADVPGANAVTSAELVMLSGVEQGGAPALSGDTVHSTLVFAKDKGLAYQYKRGTVSIYANVVRATHGETRNEVLGNGNGATPMPSFALKQSPLTYVSAPTVDGVASTLKAVVNGMEWHEIRSLALAAADDRSFVTSTDDSGKTSLTFGDGVHGARVPTGIENVVATYRNGIGVPGNVRANQISLLATKPLGVKDVVNPLAATGGADAETRDQARRNVPLAVLALDRLVSVADYADFARIFGGVGKAASIKLGDRVWVTIAGAGDVPIDDTSDLYQNLLQALQRYGDPSLAVGLSVRQLIALTFSAKVGLLPDFVWTDVEPRLRAALLDRFGFDRRQLARGIYLSEVIVCMQKVRGVASVDVDTFDSLDETAIRAGLGDNDKQDGNDAGISSIAVATVAPVAVKSYVPALPARYDKYGALQPAQLAYFLPGVPDTLLLQEASP